MADILSVMGDFADKIPGIFDWSLRRIYKEEVIKNRIVVDLTSHTGAVKAQLLGSADITALIRISNYTPFELTVENITLEFRWDGINRKIYKGNYEKIPASAEQNIYLKEDLSTEQAHKIAKAAERPLNAPTLSCQIDFSNRLYRFQKYDQFRDFPLDIVNKDNVLKQLKEENAIAAE